MTGHLVLSTLHTNDAASTIARLLDLGVEPFLIPTCLRAVVAQRLIRKVCPSCGEEHTPSDEELNMYDLKDWDGTAVKQGAGCPDCGQTGYRGRTGIFEILEVTPAISKAITDKVSADMLTLEAMKEGMVTLREDALAKVKDGITTLEEVFRVT